MRIVFERTGGFAGLKLKATLEESSLPPRQSRRLRALLAESRFFELPLRIESPGSRPDRFQYRLTVENDNCIHTVQAAEEALSPALRALLDWLTIEVRRPQ
jgi:hypothetical protein